MTINTRFEIVSNKKVDDTTAPPSNSYKKPILDPSLEERQTKNGRWSRYRQQIFRPRRINDSKQSTYEVRRPETWLSTAKEDHQKIYSNWTIASKHNYDLMARWLPNI